MMTHGGSFLIKHRWCDVVRAQVWSYETYAYELVPLVAAFLKLKDAACQIFLVSLSRPSLCWLLPPQRQCFQECNSQHGMPECLLTSWWPSLHAFAPVFCRNVSLNELKASGWTGIIQPLPTPHGKPTSMPKQFRNKLSYPTDESILHRPPTPPLPPDLLQKSLDH
jgi:hypothetical protein